MWDIFLVSPTVNNPSPHSCPYCGGDKRFFVFSAWYQGHRQYGCCREDLLRREPDIIPEDILPIKDR